MRKISLIRLLGVVALSVLLGACRSYGPLRGMDRDLDGIADSADRCPLSIPGAAVDAQGCEADRDGDGIGDLLDRCPATPEGALVDLVGCPVDNDCDGVPDHQDRCPRSRLGAQVDERGCAGGNGNGACPDEDADGVCDLRDACPGTPPGVAVNERGCDRIALDGVNFERDRSELTLMARRRLDEILPGLRQRQFQRLTVVGHTDSRRTEEYNKQLSEARAEAVRDYLISQGIAPERIGARGDGESQPIASNDTDEGRAQNRRVELHLDPDTSDRHR